MQKLRIAAVSLHSDPTAKALNLARIEHWCRAARSEGAELVCFPAMAVTGFWRTSEMCHHAEILKNDLTNPALVHPIGPSVPRLAQLTRENTLQLAVGIIEDLDFYHLRNSVAVFQSGQHLGTAAEIHTPRTPHAKFSGALECPVFKTRDCTLGVMVGDDVFYPEVARMLAVQGADVLAVAMATPLAPDTSIAAWREQISQVLAVRALENGVAIIAVDAAGCLTHPVEGTKDHFPGQVMAFDARGRLIAESPLNSEEKMVLADLEISGAPRERLERRRPFLYQHLVREEKRADVPGTRQADWDAQGELLWSRLRDFGFFGADLCGQATPDFENRNSALIVTGPSLPPLRPYRAVVLTRPCLAQLSGSEAVRLEAWVSAGGTLVLDGYCGRNDEVLGPLAGLRGNLRQEVYLPSYEDASRSTVRIRASCDDAIFMGMETRHAPKVWGQAWLPQTDTQVDARPLAHFHTPDGRILGPGIYCHAYGEGRVYTFAYSLGYSQLLLMEGRGTTVDVGSFPERIAPELGPSRDGDVNTWGDQIVTDAEDQFFPSADHHLIPLLNILLDSVGDHVLVSPIPDGRECGVIFTGDSDRAGAELINQYTEMLARHEIRPTQFILRGGYDARELNPECEYGVHPLFHETERECMDILVSYGFDRTKLICGRRHCLIQYGLTDTLERMAECGVRFTSNNWDFPYPETHSTAFLYGTALPHHIYDWKGARIGIVDIPQVFMDYEPFLECARAAWLDVRRTHGVGAWNFHPQNFVIPGVKEAIEWLAQQAGKEDVWCGTMGEYGQWYLQRDRIELACAGAKVTIEGGLPEGLTLLSPSREIEIGGQRSRAARASTWYGREYWVHHVQVSASVSRKSQLTT